MSNTIRQSKRAGFTLVEMLVVIAIIGILAAILIPTLYNAVRAANRNKIAQEIGLLHQQIESYKQAHADYPPDFIDWDLVKRHLRMVFPRHTEPFSTPSPPTPSTFLNTNVTWPNGAVAKDPNGNLANPANLDPSEALVFWLGMIKTDARMPLNGPGGPDPKGFKFDENRLKDLDRDGWLSYVAPNGKDMPYVYFDSRTYYELSGSPPVVVPKAEYIHDDVLDPNDPPIRRLYPFQTSTSATGTLKFANETTFQIISAGLDGEFGAMVQNVFKVFPFGINYATDGGDKDNMANFSDGRAFEDHME